MKVEKVLREFVEANNEGLELILLNDVAILFYGLSKSVIGLVFCAEIVKGDLFRLYEFLASKGIPADLSENIGGWSVIGMPEGYRDRAYIVYEDEKLKIKLLNPYDFIVAKLRRGTHEDIEDTIAVFRKFKLSTKELDRYIESAIANSIKDTSILAFKKRYNKFKEILQGRRGTGENIKKFSKKDKKVTVVKVIPILVGTTFRSVEELLEDYRAVKELWLEILFNDEIDWEKYLDNPAVKEQYKKACKYYRNFGYLLDRKPLSCRDYTETDRDFPEYRRFEEILNFLSWSKNRIIP